MANAQKNVDLVIRARDESKAVWRGATAEMQRYQAAASKTAQYRGLLKNQQDTAKAARDLSLDMKKVGLAASVDQVRGWRDARAAAKAATDQVRAFNMEQARSRGVTSRGSFKALDTVAAATVATAATVIDASPREKSAAEAAARAQRNYAAALTAKDAAARESVAAERALSAAQMQTDATAEQLVAAQRRVTQAYTAEKSAADALTAAQHRVATAQKSVAASGDLAARQAASWGTRKGRGPLGLRPFELQNLGYQINDVFTQIASGTPVMQVAAQQGGQFIQIFPKLGAAMLRALPIIGLVTIALSPFISAMSKANTAAGTLKEFDLLLTRSGEGASYQAQGLANAAEALDRYDGSIKDARAALSEFVGDSVAPEYLERFGRTALDFARVMKVDVKDAAKQVSDAFTGNADAVLALDDQLNFLTDAERKHIEKLRESKKDAEARTTAFAIFERRYGETAAKMRGPWTRILNDFAAAWGHWVDSVNIINFDEARGKIAQLMNDVSRLMAMLPGARSANSENASAWVDRAFAARNRAALAVDRERRGGNVNRIREAEYLLQVRERQLNQAQTSLAMNQLQDGTASVLQGGPTSQPRDTTLDPPAPANSGSSRQSDAERLVERQREFVAGLLAENEARKFQLSLMGQQERQARINEAIRDAELSAAEVQLTLTAEQRQAIIDTTGAIYDAEVAERARQAIAQTALELAEKRGEVETRVAFITRSLLAENLSLESELGRQRADQLGQLWDLEDAARRRAAAEKSVNDLLSLRADLTEQIAFYEDSGQQGTADRLREQLVAVNAELLSAVDGAINMWTALGGEGSAEALSRLGLLRDQVSGIGKDVVVSGRQINELIADGGMNAFQQFSQSIAEGANAFTALRDAFLRFAADFLSKIAEMIAQQAFLNMLKSWGMTDSGGGGVGGTVSGWINGLVRHQGGMVGQGGGRPVPLAAFAGATRYHTGGVIGLQPNERAVVAQLGEEVLTAGDPRHRNNLGKTGGGRDRSLKVVNVFDPAELLDAALGTEAGERVILNHVRRNSGAWKAAIG